MTPIAALIASACASPSPATRTGLATTHGPAAAAQGPSSAAPSSALPANSAAALAETRPPPSLEPRETEIAEVLGDVCRLGYDTSGKKVTAGCAECAMGEPFDASAWEISSSLGWSPYIMITGAFSVPDAEERFVALAGYCNPKHQAYAFLQRRAGRWAVLTMQQAHDQDECKLLHRKGITDVVLCTRSRDYIGGESLDTLEAIKPTGEDVLLALRHWRTTDVKRRAREVFDFSIEAFDLRDVDGDGWLDVDVSLRERSFPTVDWKPEAEELPFGDVAHGKRRQVVVNGRNGKLVIDAPESQALVRRMSALTPPPTGI